MEDEELLLYDSIYPNLTSGDWRISVSHELSKENRPLFDEPYRAEMEFSVSGFRFHMDENKVLGMYPAYGASGNFSRVLPHITLSDGSIPWMHLAGEDRQIPCMALLLIREDELSGNGIRILDGKNPEDSAEQPCRKLELPCEFLWSILPRMEEIKYLSHCRKIEVSKKAEEFSESDGTVSVIVCNRFPCGEMDAAVQYHVYLISLEGIPELYAGRKDAPELTQVISLYDWSFYHDITTEPDFAALGRELAAEEGNLLLRFPQNTHRRLEYGFVPLNYHARTGEKGFAWYRSPFTPVPVCAMKRDTPFFSADAAIIYDSEESVFDMSLAAAWEAGRLAALSDSDFGKKIMELRFKMQDMIDLLMEKLMQKVCREESSLLLSDEEMTEAISRELQGLGPGDIRKLMETERDFLLHNWDEKNFAKIKDIRQMKAKEQIYLPFRRKQERNIKRMISDFFYKNSDQILIMLEDKFEAVARWLSKLLLFYKVPFDYLVPDSRMLPAGSVRFFYIDTNWQRALIDGAMSLGVDCSRQRALNSIIRESLYRTVNKKSTYLRDALYTRETGCTGESREQEMSKLVSGFLLNSELVNHWKTMTVHPFGSKGEEIPILRLEKLSSHCLLGIFNGTPDRIEFREPFESIRLGTNKSGEINIYDTSSGVQNIGKLELWKHPNCIRGKNILNIMDDKGEGVIKELSVVLERKVNPSLFALQLMQKQECISFEKKHTGKREI